MLNIQKVSKSYKLPDGFQEVLKELSFDFLRGSSVAILGESGSGKSTLLHVMAGLEKPDSGTIKLDGVNIWTESEARR